MQAFLGSLPCAALVCAAVALSVSCTIPVDSDEFRARVLQPRSFDAPVDRCVQATRTALADQGYQIKTEKPGEIVTQRRTFTVNAQSKPILPTEKNPAQRVQMEQSDQLWIDIEGERERCTVSVSRLRIWNGVEEMTEIQGGGADWARKHLVEALYREIDANL